MSEGDLSNKHALQRFIEEGNELKLVVPGIPDQIDDPQPHLVRPNLLVQSYATLFSKMRQQLIAELDRSPNANPHIFRETHQLPNYNLEQIVFQFKRGTTHQNMLQSPHAFIEFLSAGPSDQVNMNDQLDDEDEVDRLERINAAQGFTRGGTSTHQAKSLQGPTIESGDRDPLKPLVTRIVTVPRMDESIFSENGKDYDLFHRDLGLWWKKFFGPPALESETWIQNVPPKSRSLTAWTFHYAPFNDSIQYIEYFRKNIAQSYTGFRMTADHPGIKLIPHSEPFFNEEHSQLIRISQETGEVINDLRGVVFAGRVKNPVTYILRNGNLHDSAFRYSSPQWKFGEVVAEILGDIPIKVEESPAEETA